MSHKQLRVYFKFLRYATTVSSNCTSKQPPYAYIAHFKKVRGYLDTKDVLAGAATLSSLTLTHEKEPQFIELGT